MERGSAQVAAPRHETHQEGDGRMAYRFLLEVPAALAAEANIAVAEAGDAQVVLVRDSHGLGFDDPYVDLTIAAHSLRVVETLYDWFDQLGASRPDIRIVLHSGDRLALEAYDRGQMVAAIRRDQPWVERTIPKIGEHEPETPTEAFTEGITAAEEILIDSAGGNAPSPGVPLAPAPAALAVQEAERERLVRFRALNHIAVRVNDLPKAERFYADFFNMELLGRARRDPIGEYIPLDGAYGWQQARRQGAEADVAFLRNGPVTLALIRAGRGARLESAIFDHLSVTVDATTYTRVKGEVLMRSFLTLVVGETTFTFRDPFGVVWELRVQGTPDLAF